jgi:ABC-type multidrug transport system fused ATPase/permease subunit
MCLKSIICSELIGGQALAVLRMIPTTGSVIIDGVRTNDINLNDLRSHVTIIPQDPVSDP